MLAKSIWFIKEIQKKKKKENKENVESCSQESEDYFKVDSYGEVKWVTK